MESNSKSLIVELAKAKATFQQRAILAAMGINPSNLTTATTNGVAQPVPCAKEILDNTIEMINRFKPDENALDHMKAGKDWYKHLKSQTAMPAPPQGMFGGLFGINIFVDESLPPDIMEARTKDGRVLEIFHLGGANQ